MATARPAAAAPKADGRASATPILPPKSKAPLFIGLGAAAAIGIGAFVMFSGSGKQETKRSNSPASSSGVKSAVTSTPATAAPSSGLASIRLEPGKWERLKGRISAADVTASGATLRPDGSIKLGSYGWRLSPFHAQDIAVRARFKRDTDLPYTGISVRLAGNGFRQINLGETSTRFRTTSDNKRIDESAPLNHTPGIAQSKPVMLEIAAIGNRNFGTVDGRQLAIQESNQAVDPGGIMLFGSGCELSDIEVMLLDGVGEDKYPTFVKAAIAATPTTKPASSSPPLPVSQSSDRFPPGKWVKTFTNPDEMGRAGVTSNDKKLSQKDGWFVPSMTDYDIRFHKNIASNVGIRGRFKPSKTAVSFNLYSDSVSYDFNFNSESGTLELRRIEHASLPPSRKQLFSGKYAILPEHHDFVVEFAHVEGRYIGRVNDQVVFAILDEKRRNNRPSLFKSGEFRDIEVINLDGLSEAEALKILGVDEKGNDLRQKPAAVASATPAATKAAMAPASSSPSLPVAQSSDPKFPPGQWVKVFTKFEELPEDVRKPDVDAKFEDGWLIIPRRPSGDVRRLNLPPLQGGRQTNMAVR